MNNSVTSINEIINHHIPLSNFTWYQNKDPHKGSINQLSKSTKTAQAQTKDCH
jgi:hypothetical protein